jgi:anaerobic selenocysteine-containing dehydrogenase
MTRSCDVLDTLVPHGSLELNPEDAGALGLEAGETAVVRSRRGRIEIPVDVTERVERGTVFLAFHFREHPANALTIAALDPVATIPEFKACAVSVEKAAVTASAP